MNRASVLVLVVLFLVVSGGWMALGLWWGLAEDLLWRIGALIWAAGVLSSLWLALRR